VTRRALGLRAWLFGSHLAVLALPLLMVFVTGGLARDLIAQTEADLRNQATIVGLWAEAALKAERVSQPDASLQDVDLAEGLRALRDTTLASVRLVDAQGVVVASSGGEIGEALAGRPEIDEALAGAAGMEVRPRAPVDRRTSYGSVSRAADVRLFYAQPVQIDGETVGAVVLSRTPRAQLEALAEMFPWWGAILPVLVTLALAWAIGSIATRSLTRLERAARRLADGAFDAVEAALPSADSRIAEVRGLTEAFLETAERLRDRIAYIGEFAAHVSHEFKTPLATLHGTIELWRDDDAMPPEQRTRFLDNAGAEVERLNRLVTGLLALARAEQATQLSPTPFDPWIRRWAATHAVPVEGTVVGTVPIDSTWLTAALDNLVDNAERHGGPTRSLHLQETPGRVWVTLRDDGPGIGAANQTKAFDRFFTTARERGGTGLGLALVRAVAQAHGGRATLTSVPGRTEVTLELPCPSRSA
jgi:signal transduction histidine kinase